MKVSEVNNVDKLEEYFSTCRKIKFSNEIQINSLDDIFDNLYGKYGSTSGLEQKETFYTKGGFHCEAGRYRSINDFFKLVKFYFRDKTVKDIVEFLYNKEKSYNDEKKYINYGYCTHIRKYNFRGVGYASYYDKINTYDFNDTFPNFKQSIESLVK